MNITYNLTNVEILDFQLPETKPQSGSLQVNCSFSFNIVPNATGKPDCIECTGALSYVAGMFVALSTQIKETFRVSQQGWAIMCKDTMVTIPVDLQKELALSVIGTARGAIAARTAGSWLQPYFLPMIDPAAMIKEDLCFKAQMRK